MPRSADVSQRSKDPFKTAARRARTQRRVGEDAVCPCGEKRPAALISGRKKTVCYECDLKRRGKSTVEAHHVAGCANSPTTVEVPANDHRAELSQAQCDWPPNTLRNPAQSPRLAKAARIRGVIDTVEYLMRTELIPMAVELEAAERSSEEPG